MHSEQLNEKICKRVNNDMNNKQTKKNVAKLNKQMRYLRIRSNDIKISKL